MPSTSATAILLQTLGDSAATWLDARPWGVAYSGGQDSAVLLWALSRIAGAGRLQALHVDHGWRSTEERERESQIVQAWCQTLGVNLWQFPPPSAARATEQAARIHRYRCFREFLSLHPQSPVFLAHHADDQAETILMRILKGRSWQGLGGISMHRGPFIRPMLGLPQSLLAEVAREQAIPFHEDSTNADDGPTRNFLRLRVFPLLRERFPRVRESLGDLALAWKQLAPSSLPDPAWRFFRDGAECSASTWDQWGPLVRQAQLLAVAARVRESPSLSRRFLETVSTEGRTSAAGNGWRWRRVGRVVRWEAIAASGVLEYFVKATPGVVYDLGSYRFSWTADTPPGSPSSVLRVPSVDPALPWVWRSPVSGMSLSSTEGPWDRKARHRRLGALEPDRCALVIQNDQVIAVVDPSAGRIRWFDSRREKLNNTGIFVTLVTRSDYER